MRPPVPGVTGVDVGRGVGVVMTGVGVSAPGVGVVTTGVGVMTVGVGADRTFSVAGSLGVSTLNVPKSLQRYSVPRMFSLTFETVR